MAIEDEDLAKAVTRELEAASTWKAGELESQQTSNLNYYNREEFGNERDGESRVVTADVMETIEGIMPELMKIFASGDNAVEFEPVGPEDEAAAEQATDYLNHIFMRRMDGFKLLYDWFKDALLMKNGVIKVGWEEKDDITFHNFSGITQQEIDILDAEAEVEEIEIEETDDPLLFDVRVKRVLKGGQPYAETIEPENFYIKERSRSIADSDFHAHEMERSVGEMISLGYDEDDLTDSDGETPGTNQLENARFNSPSEGSTLSGSATNAPEDKMIKVVEAFIRVYDEEDKVVKLIRVLQVGGTVLEQEEVNRSCFISLTPIMMPHKYTGIAVADLVRDVQEINSQLWRQMLNNLTLQNAGRWTAVEGRANIQDLLDNKIGGIVRMKEQGAVQRLDTPNLSPFTVEALDRLQEKKELRVGVSKMTAGLDSNALTSHTTATGVNQVMSAAQQKILLIARIFAETGVRDLFRFLYEEVRTHNTTKDMVRLRGQFVEVNPFDWIDRKDMQVTVGIGNGNKDQQAFHLQQIGQMLQAVGSTDAGYLITPQHTYNFASEVVSNAGYKNTNTFIGNPNEVPPPQPQPSPEMVMAQGEAAKDQADAQLKQVQAQTEQAKAQNEATKLQLEREKFEWQKKVEAAELTVEVDQRRPVGVGK